MKFRFVILGLLGSIVLSAQGEFTLKSGEQLSQMSDYGHSTERLEAFIKTHPGRLYDHSQALLLISYNYMQLGDYENALTSNEQSLAIKARLHADDLVDNYVRFGAIHLLKGNPHKALSYLLRTKDLPIEALQQYAVIDGHLAATYRDLGQFEQAKIYYEQAIETLLIEFPRDHPEVIAALYNLGQLHVEWGKPVEARSYFLRGLSQNTGPSKQALVPLLQNALGTTYLGNWLQAEKHHRQALDIATRVFGNHHRETAQSALSLATALINQNKRDEARSFIQLAIRSLTPEQANLKWEEMPDLANIVVDDGLLGQALGLKSRWLMQSALPEEQKLPVALSNCELAGKLFSLNLDDQLDHRDRFSLLPLARVALEPGIQAGMAMGVRNGGKTAMQRSFQLVELLKELQLRVYTSSVSQEPDSYVTEDRKRFRALHQAEVDFRLQPLDLTRRQELTRKQGAYAQFKETWRKSDPDSYQKRFGREGMEVHNVQQKLEDKTALLSYFVGEQSLYLFGISQDDFVAYDLSGAYAQGGNPFQRHWIEICFPSLKQLIAVILVTLQDKAINFMRICSLLRRAG